MPIHARMALRNIRRNPRRSLLTILAIAFGLFCLIVFQAMKAGLHREMVTGTIQLDAGSVQIHATGYQSNHVTMRPLADSTQLLNLLPGAGFNALAPRIKTQAMILSGPNSSAILLSGIEPTMEAKVTFIGEKIVSGTYLDRPGTILLGKELADTIDAMVGDEVLLMGRDLFGHPISKKLTIGGLFSTGLTSFNRSQGYLLIQDARKLFGLNPDDITEISLLTEPAAAGAAAETLRTILAPEQYQIRTWRETAPDVQQLIELNDATMTLLVLIVFAMVAMGITNTMNAVVYERFREFGILATIGVTPGGIVGLVVLESLFLALAATVLGSAVGSMVCLYLSQVGLDLTQLTSANQYFADSHVLKAHLLAGDVLLANGMTLATSLVAVIYPASKAARLDPVKALAHT